MAFGGRGRPNISRRLDPWAFVTREGWLRTVQT